MFNLVLGVLTWLIGGWIYYIKKIGIWSSYRGMHHIYWFPEKESRRVGAVIITWGIVFTLIGLFDWLIMANQLNFLWIFWAVGWFVIWVITQLLYRSYLKDELAKRGNDITRFR